MKQPQGRLFTTVALSIAPAFRCRRNTFARLAITSPFTPWPV